MNWKICNFISDFVIRIKEAFADVDDHRATAKFGSQLEGLQDMWDKALLAAEHNAEMSAIADRVSKGMPVNPTQEVQHSTWDDEVDAKQLSKSKKKNYIPLHTRISDYSIIEGEDYTLQKYISQRHYSEILTWHADKTNSVFSHVLDDYIYVMWLDDEYNVHCIERFKDADVWEEEKRFDANKNKRETDRYTSTGVRNGERSSDDSLQGVDGQSDTILSRTVGRTSIGENNRERGYPNSYGDGEERNTEELTDGNENAKYQIWDGYANVSRGIPINDSDFNYSEVIMNGEKLGETREKRNAFMDNVAKSGERIALVHSGVGNFKAYATTQLGVAEWIPADEWDSRYADHRVPKGSEYDVKRDADGKPLEGKWYYPFINLKVLDEEVAPTSHSPRTARFDEVKHQAWDTEGNELTEAVNKGKSKHFDVDREHAAIHLRRQAWDDGIEKTA